MEKQKKRKQSSGHQKQAKRQKASHAAQGTKRAVNVDALGWRTVEVPEMFDDAEGFFGLEEVEGVEIIRQGDKVQFVTTAQSEPESDEFNGFDDSAEDKSESGPSETTKESSAGKPKGTPDGKTEAGPKGKPDGKPDGKKKDQTKEQTKKKPQKKADVPAPASKDPELETNVFSKLADVAEETEEDIDMSEWVSLGLSTRIISAIAGLKFSKPTAIQAKAIPEILGGDDVIGKASTGSGKTLAFGIPIVEQWLTKSEHKKSGGKHAPIALILSPTRELAHQITNHIKELCVKLPVSPYICSVTGGLAVQKQQRQLAKADIVIGTPGRLWEVLSTDTALMNSFREISYLVVDEADRLLTEGHFKEAEEIFDALDRVVSNEEDEESSQDEEDEDEDAKPNQKSRKKRQTLVFSATFNRGLQQKLAGKARYDLLDEKQSMEHLLKKLNFRGQPKFIDVNPTSRMADKLKEGLIECGAMEKDLYLYSVLLMQSKMRALVFTNSISAVRRLTPLLQNLNLPVLPLHSEMPQKARLRSIERFTETKDGGKGAASILVATDVAARGLDIPGIDLVVHYHVPRAADAYVHRSGRTARAESSGVSILLCAPEEVLSTRRLIAKVHSAAGGRSKPTKDGYFIRTIDIDRKLVSRLRERVVLAKKIADSLSAKDRGKKDEDWMRNAAEELGVEYDSDELENAGRWAGKGSERKKKEKEARSLTKADINALRAELKHLLSKRVNVGVSEKYLGRVDVNELLRGGGGEFLGSIEGLGLDDL